jgi:hypothetical protein
VSEERLDPELAKLFREEPIPVPPPGAAERVFTKLNAALPVAVTSHLVAKALAVFALGALAGGTGVALLRPSPPARVVYVDRPVPAAAPSSSASQPAPEVSAPPRATAEPRPSAPRVDDIAQERLVLDDARDRLSRGEATEALKRLSDHERRFPRGKLVEEREALAIQALVNAGRYDEARARATAFRNRSPNSVFLPAIDATLSSIP